MVARHCEEDSIYLYQEIPAYSINLRMNLMLHDTQQLSVVNGGPCLAIRTNHRPKRVVAERVTTHTASPKTIRELVIGTVRWAPMA